MKAPSLRRTVILLMALLTLGVFVADLLTPRGIAIWALYMIPLWLTLRLPTFKSPIIMAVVSSTLIIVDYLFSPGVPSAFAIANRLLGLLAVWVIALLLVQYKRVEDRTRTNEKRSKAQRERLVVQLREALANIKTLKGLLHICTSCQRVRDQKGSWSELETYVRDHSEAHFRHDLCPTCGEALFPSFYRPREQYH